MPDDCEGRAIIPVEQEILDVAQALIPRILERGVEDLRCAPDNLRRRGRAPLWAVGLGAEELTDPRQPLRIRSSR